MRVTMHHGGLLLAAVVVAVATHAWAFPGDARKTKAACAACHTNVSGGAELTAAGGVFKAEAKAPEATVAGADYVGTNKCKMCHIAEFKSWQESPHAKTLERLMSAPDSVSAAMAALLKVELAGAASEADACLSCHVTGFHLTGGYPAADSAKTAAVANVGCEGCHGPGSKHVSAVKADKKGSINGAVTEKMCTHCHTSTMSPKFNFEEYKKLGVHAVKAVTK